MDPTANLLEQLRIARDLLWRYDRDLPLSPEAAVRLAELVEALAGWIDHGGGLPLQWVRKGWRYEKEGR